MLFWIKSILGYSFEFVEKDLIVKVFEERLDNYRKFRCNINVSSKENMEKEVKDFMQRESFLNNKEEIKWMDYL